MKLVFRQSAAAVVVTLAMLVGACGKEKESPRRAAENTQDTETGQRRNQSNAQGTQPSSSTSTTPQTQTNAGTSTTQGIYDGQIPITEQQRRQVEMMLQALRNNQLSGNGSTTSSGLLAGADPKLATALLQCPGALVGGVQNLGVVSVLSGLLGGQGVPSFLGNTQTGQQFQTSTQPTLSSQVIDVASCLLKTIF